MTVDTVCASTASTCGVEACALDTRKKRSWQSAPLFLWGGQPCPAVPSACDRRTPLARTIFLWIRTTFRDCVRIGAKASTTSKQRMGCGFVRRKGALLSSSSVRGCGQRGAGRCSSCDGAPRARRWGARRWGEAQSAQPVQKSFTSDEHARHVDERGCAPGHDTPIDPSVFPEDHQHQDVIKCVGVDGYGETSHAVDRSQQDACEKAKYKRAEGERLAHIAHMVDGAEDGA